ncbi:MAG: TetR/AcrR family transcriptional regulator [Thermodesulfobacteriota bacterium]
MKNEIAKTTRSYGGVRASLRLEGRRRKLIEAGLTAFGTLGYAKASIKGICNLAGLTERYFYESFGSKEELLAAVYQDVVEGLMPLALERLEEPFAKPSEIVCDTLRIYFTAMKEDPRKARMLYIEVLGVSPAIDRAYQEATRRLAGIIVRVMGLAFPGLDWRALSRTIVPTGLTGALTLIAINWILEEFKTPLDDILAQVTFLVDAMDAFLTPKP